jgi:limonene-1,2-epoxide hydrolase
MADCYHQDARFNDIAFDLHGRKEIRAMWRLICKTDIQATVESIVANDAQGQAKLVEVYTFSDTGRRVRNEITGHFKFKDGLIIEHRDICSPLSWARQAFGGLKGELVGRVGFLRRMKARKKIRDNLVE